MSRYGDDIRAVLRIAIPLAFAELGWMSMSVVDNIMVGRLPDSATAIGSASIGSAFFYAFAIFGIGLMSGLDTLVSQAFGAGDWPEARRSLVSGLALAACVTPFLAGCILGTAPLLGMIGVTAGVREQAIGFTRVLVWSLPLLLVYTTFRRYLQGIHYVRPVTFALVSSNLINVLGNWILIYGHWGAPAMGVRGSALSTVIARVYLAGVMLGAVLLRDPQAFAGGRADLAHVRKLLGLGLPRHWASPLRSECSTWRRRWRVNWTQPVWRPILLLSTRRRSPTWCRWESARLRRCRWVEPLGQMTGSARIGRAGSRWG